MQKCCERVRKDWKVWKGEKLCPRSSGAKACNGAQLRSCFFLWQYQRMVSIGGEKNLTDHFVLLCVEESPEDVFQNLFFSCESV